MHTLTYKTLIFAPVVVSSVLSNGGGDANTETLSINVNLKTLLMVVLERY